MKQATIDRIKYLLETPTDELEYKDGDAALLKKIEKRVFKAVAEKMLANPGKMTFAEHRTIQ